MDSKENYQLYYVDNAGREHLIGNEAQLRAADGIRQLSPAAIKALICKVTMRVEKHVILSCVQVLCGKHIATPVSCVQY